MTEDGTSSGDIRDDVTKDKAGSAEFIFFLGLLGIFLNEFFLAGISSVDAIAKWISYGLLIISAFFLIKKRSIITVIFFIIWYEVLGAPKDWSVLFPWVIPVVLIAVVVDVFLGRREHKEENWNQTIGMAFGYGLLLILFFFLDVSGLHLLTGNPFYLIIPVTIQGLALSFPWWSFLALFYLKPGTFKTTVSALFALYLILIIISLSSFSTTMEEGILPGAEELASQARVEGVSGFERLGITLACFRNIVSPEGDSFGECKEQKESELEWKVACRNAGFTDESSSAFNTCMKEQEEQKNNPAQYISGTIDPTLKEPMKATLRFKERSVRTFIPGQAYTAFLEIENPRRNSLQIEATCLFVKRGSQEDNVSGVFQGSNTFETHSKEFETPISCKPEEELSGSYDVLIKALLKGIVLEPHQEKAFVGPPEKKELLEKEINGVIKVATSQSAPDFVHYVFSLGYGTEKDPIVVDDPNRNLLLTSKIKNIGSGRIAAIKSYQIFLEGFSAADDDRCFYGQDIPVPSEKNKFKEVLLPSCIIADYPEEYKPQDPDVWKHVDIRAQAYVDYELEAKQNIPELKP